MRTSEFVACSIAFHIALLIAALLLPSPFPAPKEADSGIAYVELQKNRVGRNRGRVQASGDDFVPLTSGTRLKSTSHHGNSMRAADASPYIGNNVGARHVEEASKKPASRAPEKASDRAVPQPMPLPAQAAPEPPKAPQPPQIALTALDRPGSSLKVEKGKINFKYQRGWPMPSMVKVGIASSGEAASWLAKSDSDWIIVSPASGSGAGTLKVGVDVSRLQLGFYEGTVRITAQGQGVKGDEVDITLMVLPKAAGGKELPHSSWDEYMNGECKVCHLPEQVMAAREMLEPKFCGLCHSPSGMAKSLVPGKGGHPMMADAGSGGTKMPTRGTVATGPKSDRMGTHLLGGKKIVCVTCHNVMEKPGEHARSWEMTETGDQRTYALSQGGWENSGYIVPKVYVTHSLMPIPRYLNDARQYLADPRDYTYDESDGAITFKRRLDKKDYVYVTLTNPYLRVTTENNALCFDCHFENTHEGMNCLVCHRAHGTGNIKGIREMVRTPDGTRKVIFISRRGVGSFASGAGLGICEVCHPLKLHKDGKDYSGTDCTRCHSHKDGFGA